MDAVISIDLSASLENSITVEFSKAKIALILVLKPKLH
jgi:hypothetical protein